MGERTLDPDWKGWLQTNLDRQCDPVELLGILVRHEFALGSIREAMGGRFPVGAFSLGDGAVDHHALAEDCGERLAATARARRFPSHSAQLYSIDGFLAGEACDELVALIEGSLHPSSVTIKSPTDRYFRTNFTSELAALGHPPVERLDDAIARALGISLAYSEGLQGQHYSVTQEFKPHTDFFEPGTAEYDRFGGPRGNRTWTFMIYLCDVAKGGGTDFVRLGHRFEPRKGMAVVWNNLHPDGTPNYETLHAGMPVLEGRKAIITKWFREKGEGPMFLGRETRLEADIGTAS